MARPRPTADEPVFVPWGSMTRFEMISWYWADYLLVAQRDLYKLPGSAWRTVRFGGSESLDWIQELFGFLELEGFEEDVVGGLLASKPGSFTEQSTNEQARHEHWSDWDAEKTEQFDRYAASAMVQFGYYGIDRLPPVGGANPDPRAPLMVPPDDVQRQIWGNLSRHPAVSVWPSESMLVIGVEDVAPRRSGPGGGTPRLWGRCRTMSSTSLSRSGQSSTRPTWTSSWSNSPNAPGAAWCYRARMGTSRTLPSIVTHRGTAFPR